MTKIPAFLKAAGWGDATAAPLAGDASARRYLRLWMGEQRAILMDAPVAAEVDRASLSAFRTIGAHLRANGLSAPQEIAADTSQGLILMEDLGDATLAHLLTSDPKTAKIAYHMAATLPYGDKPLPLACPNASEMAAMADLTFSLIPESDALRARLLAALADALNTHAPGPAVLSLRDVHAENLLWLPDRMGHAKVGLLDFQDALLLPRGYDLASLLDDPRRDVPEAWRDDLISQFSTSERINTLSLQRNLRILGIFHRLATRLGKPSYAAFLPRTRALITRATCDLPALRAPVAELLDRTAHWSVT